MNGVCGSAATQELLRGDGAVLTVLRGFRAGTPGLMPWAHLCGILALDAVSVFSNKPALTQAVVAMTQQLAGTLLEAAGQACPRLSECSC